MEEYCKFIAKYYIGNTVVKYSVEMFLYQIIRLIHLIITL